MSLAERQKAAQKEMQSKAAQASALREKEASVWSGLDMMGMSQASTTSQGTAKFPPAPSNDGWIFDKMQSLPGPTAPATVAQQASSVLDDDWGLGDFGATSSNARRPIDSTKSNVTPMAMFDSFDDGDIIPESFVSRKQAPTQQEANLGDDEDVLGLLGKPVEAVPKAPPRSRSVRIESLLELNADSNLLTAPQVSRANAEPD